MDTLERLLPAPERSFFLLGVRGSGKSTWARRNFASALWFDLLDESLFQDLLRDPGLFAGMLESLKPGDWVVIDEVQRLPSLLNEVHRWIETRKLRFALLGSSARKLKAAGTNLLAGRARQLMMHPLSACELGKSFDIGAALRFGTIPLIVDSEDPRATLDSYVQLYLREEIRAEALVRNLPGFVRFLPIAALFHGQVLNVTALGRDAGVSRTTVQGYLDILEDTLLVTRLPAFESKLRVRERKLPKLYWVDPGLVRANKRQLGEVSAEERGALLEGWILGGLRAHSVTSHLFDEIFYWAPAQAAQTEVDFLLRREDQYLAIEVKASENYSTTHLKGLRAIAELPGIIRRILIYQGRRSFRSSDGIDVWTIQRFHEALKNNQLWP